MSVPGLDSCIAAFLANSSFDPRAFMARRTLRETASRWYQDADGSPTLLGARVRPLGHQIAAVCRVLHDRSQRYILADEVGLGKTIEAGLILQALWHEDPEMSVLIVAPGAMIRQWQREMYLRFGARIFSCIDSTMKGDIARPLEGGLVVVSASALQRRGDLRRAVNRRGWDALVVDEAHHIGAAHPLYGDLRGISKRSRTVLVLSATPSHRRMEGLADLLALVAPDEHEPGAVDQLRQRIENRRALWSRISEISALIDAAMDEAEPSADDIEYIAGGWGDLLEADPLIRRHLEDARNLAPKRPSSALAALEEALAYARERYRLDRRIIRTRRRTLERLHDRYSERVLLGQLTYTASGGEVALAKHVEDLPPQSSRDARAFVEILLRLAATTPQAIGRFIEARLQVLTNVKVKTDGSFADAWESNGGPAEEARLIDEAVLRCPRLRGESGFSEDVWLRSAASLVGAWRSAHSGAIARHLTAALWIAEVAADNPDRKFLVFAQEVDSVEAFAAALHNVAPQLTTRKFHHGLPEDQLDDAALAFTTGPVRVLVSDDLGGEGRNFQNAWAVVHLDSPVSPGRVEQRVGRVDRLGRRADDQVRSVTITGPLEAERFLHRVHHEVFGVFTGSIGGLEFVLPGLVRQVRSALTAGREAMTEVVPAIEREVRAVRAEEDRAFDVGLDTTEAELRRAQEVAEMLSEELPASQCLAPMHWLRTLGVTVDLVQPNQTSSVRIERGNLEVSSLPGIGTGLPTFRATWSRTSALSREDCQFLAPGHRLVDSAMVALEQSLVGRWGCLARALPGVAPGSMFASGLFVMDLVTRDGHLPPGLVARARAEVGRDVTVVHFARDATHGTWETLDGPPRLLNALDVPIFRRDAGDQDLSALVPPPAKRAAWSESLGSLVPALTSAQTRIKAAQAAVIEDGMRRVKKAWRGETAYYNLLRDEGSSSERLRAIEELRFRQSLEDAVAAIEPRLDALLLVWSK